MQIVDARPADRFRGDVPEPRPGLRAGHMPGALNVPSASLTENGRLKSPVASCGKHLKPPGSISTSRSITDSCGSGVTAATLWLAFDAIGKEPQAGLYDGSWSEWGGRADMPVETGG